MRFDFKATNNQAEYEALLAGLRVCVALGVYEIEIFSDSQVVVNQVLDEYQARRVHDDLLRNSKKTAQEV